jgi:hypothetical protein
MIHHDGLCMLYRVPLRGTPAKKTQRLHSLAACFFGAAAGAGSTCALYASSTVQRVLNTHIMLQWLQHLLYCNLALYPVRVKVATCKT